MEREQIDALHGKCQEQSADLYTFLEQELPDLSIEERLKVMAHILNDYLPQYRYDPQGEKLKRQEYSITKFFPTKESS
ncbi:MAG: hypothetical protein C6I00_07220 [Nitratiruptor sp.]|nr:hypothetical protein [Nitratiruptor sp.]NPA83825.1 hypothetical protein [Campylobacterota bacterium]